MPICHHNASPPTPIDDTFPLLFQPHPLTLPLDYHPSQLENEAAEEFVYVYHRNTPHDLSDMHHLHSAPLPSKHTSTLSSSSESLESSTIMKSASISLMLSSPSTSAAPSTSSPAVEEQLMACNTQSEVHVSDCTKVLKPRGFKGQHKI